MHCYRTKIISKFSFKRCPKSRGDKCTHAALWTSVSRVFLLKHAGKLFRNQSSFWKSLSDRPIQPLLLRSAWSSFSLHRGLRINKKVCRRSSRRALTTHLTMNSWTAEHAPQFTTLMVNIIVSI